jgi:N-dimethylarginine dimethylaminohydrolase
VAEPKLLDDYTHMFLELNKEQAVEVFQRFQEALIALGHEIDVRNETRSMPLRTFHPAVLDSSVSK